LGVQFGLFGFWSNLVKIPKSGVIFFEAKNGHFQPRFEIVKNDAGPASFNLSSMISNNMY
jgi:hypothetical protein